MRDIIGESCGFFLNFYRIGRIIYLIRPDFEWIMEKQRFNSNNIVVISLSIQGTTDNVLLIEPVIRLFNPDLFGINEFFYPVRAQLTTIAREFNTATG